MTAPLDPIQTPAGLVDLERVRANVHRVVVYCRSHGIRWRPHVKTHKSVRLARLQMDAGAAGLTVATLHEAEVMAAVTPDLLLAYPPVGHDKLERLFRLPEEVRLLVGLDSPEVLEPLAAGARARGTRLGVLVEADVGMRRVGIPTALGVVELARRAADLDGVDYRGLMFYPGHIRVPEEEQDEAIDTLAGRLTELIAALEDAGLPPDIVSGGSTPTLFQSHRLPGVTEIRPGTAIFNDRDILEMHACAPEDLAYTVLATVVSTAVPGQAVIDAGSKALAKEPFRGQGSGFGVLLDRPAVQVRGLSEEHGVLDLSGTDWRPRVGDRVRVVPNHVCVSVNLQDRLWALDGDRLDGWAPEGRGR